MRTRLVIFRFALLAMVGLLGAPAPVAASNPNCPTTCPNPYYPDICDACWNQCSGAGSEQGYCAYTCEDGMMEAALQACERCGVCCNPDNCGFEVCDPFTGFCL